MRVLTINSDMDGVVVRFAATMQRLTESRTGQRFPQWRDWSPWSAWDMSRSEWHDHFEQSVLEGVFFQAPAFVGAVESLHELIDRGHRVRFVTSKILQKQETTHRAIIDTVSWLARRGLLRNEVELAFTHNKQGYEADVVIDDKPTLEWAQERAVNLLFDQPWNRDVPTFGSSVIRVHGWKEVMETIEAMGG